MRFGFSFNFTYLCHQNKRTTDMMKRTTVLLISMLTAMVMWGQTAKEVACEMTPGWNLGNTLEPPLNGLHAETAWQSTRTTREVIDFVKEQGFRSVRIPCSWHAHFDPGTTHINDEWMGRVKEVVDYCLQAGLYVVLNDHWDGGWLENSFGHTDTAYVETKCDTLSAIWVQVASAFRYADHHLLLAGLNEPSHNQDQFSPDMMRALLSYEQTFVNTVRATGGNNRNRILIVQGPATDISQTCEKMSTMPQDVVTDRLMLEVHYYTPWNFCGMERDETWGQLFYYWGKSNFKKGSNRNAIWGGEDQMEELLGRMKAQFVDRGIPVVIGEYGCNWQQLPAGESQQKHDASVQAFHCRMVTLCRRMGMVPMVWDINKTTRPTMTIVDRGARTIFCEPAMRGIAQGMAARVD